MLSSLWKKKTDLIVGIDIGSHAVKAVLLSRSSERYVLESYAIEPMPRGVVVDREIQDIDSIGKVIGKIRKKITKSVKHAAIAVSGQTVINKVIYMDATLTEQELASQIEIEADSLIPYPLDEVSLDFEALDINESDPSKINVLLSAARTESVEARASALENGGFQAKVVDVESYALSRAHELCVANLPEGAADKVIALVDIGATMTLFSVSMGGDHIYSRDQLFGSEQYTRSIASFYNKTHEEAELAKTTNDLPSNAQLEVLAPFYTILVQQIRRAIQMFLTTSGQEKIDYIVLSGGTALQEGITKVLSEELDIPTVIANPFVDVDLAEGIDAEKLEQIAPQLQVAVGLALRSFSSWHI